MTLLFFFNEPNADSNGDMLLCLKPCQFRYLLGRLSFCTCLILCLSVSVLLRGSLFFSPQISSPYKGGGKVGDNCKWLVFFF
ncbi:hypothetical protein Peur_047370 [Populus x canadensis]